MARGWRPWGGSAQTDLAATSAQSCKVKLRECSMNTAVPLLIKLEGSASFGRWVEGLYVDPSATFPFLKVSVCCVDEASRIYRDLSVEQAWFVLN
jgi:hypothetical protein